MSGISFRGTSSGQDGRFGSGDKHLISKLTKEGKFSPALKVKISMSKINRKWLEAWVKRRVFELLNYRDDDIVVSLVLNLVNPDPDCSSGSPGTSVHTENSAKKIQLEITGFLEKHTPAFMAELWTLMANAQQQKGGIPSTGAPGAPGAPVAAPPVVMKKSAVAVYSLPPPPPPPRVTTAAPALALAPKLAPPTVVPYSSAVAAAAANKLKVLVEASDTTATSTANTVAVTAAPARGKKRNRFSDADEEDS